MDEVHPSEGELKFLESPQRGYVVKIPISAQFCLSNLH